MRYKSQKIASILFISLLLNSCKRYYNCDNYNVKYVQCTKPGEDTIYYLTKGYYDQNQRIKEYYESLGYTCMEMTNYVGASTSYENITDKRDIKYLESQGFICTPKENK